MTALSRTIVSRPPDPDGPTVLLIHGFASSIADWPADRWADALPGRVLVAVDLPGHGASVSIGTAPPSAWIDALAVVARELGEIDVIAYSLGARLAWDLASAQGVRVRRMVLGGLSPTEPFVAVDLPAARAAVSGAPDPSDPLTGIILGMARAPGNDTVALLDAVEGLAAEPFSSAHPPDVPVLLVAGAEDPMAAGIGDLAQALADARVLQIPGDHLGALRGDDFRTAARRFLEA